MVWNLTPLEKQKNICDDYLSGLSSLFLSEKYNLTPNSVRNILKRNKIQLKPIRSKDLIGLKFGKLFVIERDINRLYHKNRRRCNYWMCKCDCGNTKSIIDQTLLNGNSKSCGCTVQNFIKTIRYPKQKPNILIPKTNLYKRYKNSAKKRNFPFELELEEFLSLTQLNCHYCNTVPSATSRDMQNYTKNYFVYNGIDRLDSSKGYTKNNVVPCCKKCNWAKSNSSLKDFLDWVDRIYNNLKNKKILIEKN